MTTTEMQKEVEKAGLHMRQETYATTNSRGMLASGYRWVVIKPDGSRFCQGMNPKQCWKRFQEAQSTAESLRPV